MASVEGSIRVTWWKAGDYAYFVIPKKITGVKVVGKPCWRLRFSLSRHRSFINGKTETAGIFIGEVDADHGSEKAKKKAIIFGSKLSRYSAKFSWDMKQFQFDKEGKGKDKLFAIRINQKGVPASSDMKIECIEVE